jgi:glutathione synthase/RimK-type ligase-like ATP-grasp enzyme
MQDNQVFRQRMLDRVLPEVADELGIGYRSFSKDWVHHFTKGGKQAEVFGYKFSINNAAASATADDKVATAALLEAANVPCIPHVLVYNHKGQIDRYASVEGEVVAKPLRGMSGAGVLRFPSQQEAERYMLETARFAWTVAPYRTITREIRSIVLDGDILLTYEKRQSIVEDGKVTMFNLKYGAQPTDIIAEGEVRDITLRAMKALNLRVAAVDVVEVNGEYEVLEINSGITMEHYMRMSEQHYGRGKDVYTKIIAASLA